MSSTVRTGYVDPELDERDRRAHRAQDRPGTPATASRSAPVRRGVTPPPAAAELPVGRAGPGAEALAIVPPSGKATPS